MRRVHKLFEIVREYEPLKPQEVIAVINCCSHFKVGSYVSSSRPWVLSIFLEQFKNYPLADLSNLTMAPSGKGKGRGKKDADEKVKEEQACSHTL